MTILVTGGRGQVARAVLHGLVNAGVPTADLRAAGRTPEAMAVPDGVSVVRVDLAQPATLAAALDGVDQVFLYAEEEGVDGVADTLRDAGVAHVVVLSSQSAEKDPGALGDHHRAVEDAVASRGLTLTALRPGAFAANALGWAEEIRRSGTVSTAYPESHTAPIHTDDIADVAVAALTGTAVRGRVALSGPASMSFRDQVEILGRELGRDLEVTELTPEQAREQFAGAPAPIVDALLALWAAADGVPQPVYDVSRVIGQPGRTFAQWVREHREEFAG